MANLVISGDTSGSVTLSAPAVSGTTVLTLPTTSGTLVVTGGAQTIEFAAGSAAAPSITFTGDTNTGIYSPAADTIAFTEGGVESMRIDSSGNVGIGTSSVGANHRLEVSGNQKYFAFTGNTGSGGSANPSSSSGLFLGWNRSNGEGESNIVYGLGAGASPALQFASWNGTTYTERMRIDSSGNVGIGQTPAATVILDVKEPDAGQDAISRLTPGTGNSVQIRAIAQADSTTSAMSFYTVAGSASNERMRITSGGSLLVGSTTDYGGRVQITGGSGARYLTLDAPTNGGYITFQAGGSAFADMGSALGTIGVATATDLVVSTRSGALLLGTSNAERMRIDSSGNLLVGTTSLISSERMIVRKDVAGIGGLVVQNEFGSTAQVYRSKMAASANNTSSYHFVGTSGALGGAGTDVIFIYGNGNIQNANNSYGAISDIKLKENIVDATPKLDKLMQVKIRNYNLKGDYKQHKQIGVVAQELEEVFPSLVEETTDRDADGKDVGTTTKGVKYSVFVPMLIKAIQEQQALITQLQLDVAALKGKA